MAVKAKENQFSTDPKSISLEQHGVKASQTLHTRSYCHSATAAHPQGTRSSTGMGEDNPGQCWDVQVGMEGLWSTGRSL